MPEADGMVVGYDRDAEVRSVGGCGLGIPVIF